jgi:hypothetical protein
LVNAKSHNKIEDQIQRMKALVGSLGRDTTAKYGEGLLEIQVQD